MAVSAGMVNMMPAVYTILVLLVDSATGAVLITDSKVDAEVLGSQASGDTTSNLQRARLVRRESADADAPPSMQAADDKVERAAIEKAVDAAGQKAASEVAFKAITKELEAEIKEADKKRLDAEERVKALEIEKAKKAQQKHIENERPATKAGPTSEDFLVENTKQKAKVSGLPGIAFSKDAYVLDKEQTYANLMKRFASDQRSKSGSDEDEGTLNWCDRDYPLGIWNSSNCSSDDAGNHKLILDQGMCAAAAREANATAHDTHFVIPEDWADSHPKGCFVFPCKWDAGGVCYWFNDIGDTPAYPWGAPVCQRPKFRNGTKDSNSGCPRGYDVILNENNCSEAGECLGYWQSPDFIVGGGTFHNESQHNIYPEGCFVDDEIGCVKYNPIYGSAAPQAPKGTPICNVTMVTHFPEIALPFDVFW